MASGIYVSNSVKVILGGEWGHFSLESVKIVHFHHLKVRKTQSFTCTIVGQPSTVICKYLDWGQRNTVFLKGTRQKCSISVGLRFTFNLASGTETSLQPLVTLSLHIKRNLQFFERASLMARIKPAIIWLLDKCSSILSEWDLVENEWILGSLYTS